MASHVFILDWTPSMLYIPESIHVWGKKMFSCLGKIIVGSYILGF